MGKKVRPGTPKEVAEEMSETEGERMESATPGDKRRTYVGAGWATADCGLSDTSGRPRERMKTANDRNSKKEAAGGSGRGGIGVPRR